MAYNPRDFYFKKAKEKNFAARSVFKLEEIDQRFKLFKLGQKILDLGCAPGSWSQYASLKIGRDGRVLAIDLQRVSLALHNVTFIEGDAFNNDLIFEQKQALNIKEFDIVMSDMAPKTTGIRVQDQQRSFELSMHALRTADRWLRPGGFFIAKIFQSDEFDNYLSELRSRFQKVEILRPKSTRKSSYEIFVIGLKKR